MVSFGLLLELGLGLTTVHNINDMLELCGAYPGIMEKKTEASIGILTSMIINVELGGPGRPWEAPCLGV